MRTVHRVRVAAPLQVVFALARDVEGWRGMLREYQWCHILERSPERLVFSMGGWIRGWPARWTAVQEPRPDESRITFRHIKGITRGMWVEWRFAPAGDAATASPGSPARQDPTPADGQVDVVLTHELVMNWPVIGRVVSDLIVGPIFIEYIARKTLTAVKARAEASARAPAANP